jgi:hypothetical protein
MHQMKILDFKNVKNFPCLVGDKGTMDARLRELDWLAPFINKAGWNLEFGVHTGRTINRIAGLRPDLNFFGFDSFEGLPEDWDTGPKIVDTKVFDRGGVLPEVSSNITLVKGFFDEALPQWLKGQASEGFARPCTEQRSISYLHVDCDIYSSTVTVFEYLNEYIKPGCIIRFDEICCWRTAFEENSPAFVSRLPYTTWADHEWKATEEWMRNYKRKVIPICRNWFQSGTVVVTQ